MNIRTYGEEVKVVFMYCMKCGFIKNIKSQIANCPACEIALKEVPSEYLSTTGLMFSSQESRNQFEKMIKESDDYDENANIKSKDIISQKEELHKKEVEKKVQEYQESRPQKKCPVCHSASISKISNVGKIVKVSALGILGAGDIGKTWRCNSCGCKF